MSESADNHIASVEGLLQDLANRPPPQGRPPDMLRDAASLGAGVRRGRIEDLPVVAASDGVMTPKRIADIIPPEPEPSSLLLQRLYGVHSL